MIYVQVRVKATPDGFERLQKEASEYNRLMAQDGAKPIANFVVRIGDGTGDQIHLFAYDDMNAYAQAVEKMGSDPQWQEFLGRVGPYSANVDLSILRPLPSSGLQ
jgi:hypothetical protein